VIEKDKKSSILVDVGSETESDPDRILEALFFCFFLTKLSISDADFAL
jgi:hypothetical protein